MGAPVPIGPGHSRADLNYEVGQDEILDLGGQIYDWGAYCLYEGCRGRWLRRRRC